MAVREVVMDVTDRSDREVGVVSVAGAVDTGLTQPLTDTQLRASAVPISATSLPLPTGSATEATLAAIKAKTDNLDIALSTLAVDLESITASIANFPADYPDAATLAKVEAVRALLAGTLTVTGALTDTQLRATPVPVSGTVTATTGGLTDTQLRATPVPVSGTVTATTGGLTDTQLRATAVPVSTGGLTDTELRATAVPVSGPLTDTQLRATPVPVSGTVTATTGGLTDTQLRASAVPVSLASVPSHAVTNAGTFAVQATLAAGAASIGKAEDVGSADADVGVPAMAVRKATPANTSGSDGDYEFLQMSAGRLWTSATIDAALPAGTNAIGKLAANDGIDIGDVTINNASIAVTGTFWQATQPVSGTVTANAGTNLNTSTLALEAGGNLAGAATSLALIDDVVHASDAALSKVAAIGAQFDDVAPGTTTENNIRPVRMSTRRELYSQIRDAAGNERGANVNSSNQLSVSVDNTVTVGSHAVTNAGTFAVQATVAAGATNIAKAEDVGSADADVGVPAMAVRKATPANTSGSDGDYEFLQMSAGRLWVDASGVSLTVSSHAVTNAGTFAVQVDGSALTSLQLIDDPVIADDAAFTPATSKVMMAGFEADETATDSVDEGDAGAARMTLDRKVIVNQQPHTAGGLSTFMASGSDGSTILSNAAQVIKGSAGQLYGYYIYNPNSAATFVHFYNTAAASVTVGTTNPLFTLTIPATSAANLMGANGITFSNAGWSIAATTTAGGNSAPSTGIDAVVWYA